MVKPNQEEYIKWYNLAKNHAKDQELLPELSQKEIIENISKENWLMFVKDPYKNKQTATMSSEPNIYLVFDDDGLRVGITFNNLGAIKKFLNLLSDYSAKEFQAIVIKLTMLNDNYTTAVARKVREFYGPSPEFTDEFETQTNRLNQQEFKKIIEKCAEIRNEGVEHHKHAKHKSYNETPVIDLARITIEKKKELFFSVLDDILPIYRLCMNLKTDKNLDDDKILESIKKIESGDWYLECDRSYLSELLMEKYQLDVSPQKLAKLFKSISKEE